MKSYFDETLRKELQSLMVDEMELSTFYSDEHIDEENLEVLTEYDDIFLTGLTDLFTEDVPL